MSDFNYDSYCGLYCGACSIMDHIPTLLNSLDNFIGAALANNIPIDVYNHSTGVHAFDLFNDTPRAHEIIEKTLEFFKRHLSA